MRHSALEAVWVFLTTRKKDNYLRVHSLVRYVLPEKGFNIIWCTYVLLRRWAISRKVCKYTSFAWPQFISIYRNGYTKVQLMLLLFAVRVLLWWPLIFNLCMCLNVSIIWFGCCLLLLCCCLSVLGVFKNFVFSIFDKTEVDTVKTILKSSSWHWE